MARATKAALASPNVVALPTAAPRQVQQQYNRASRAARGALREACPWPGQYHHPQQREAMRKADIIRQMPVTPELLLVSMLLQTVPEDAFLKIVERLAPSVAAGDQLSVQALTVLQCSRMTIGEQFDFLRAQQQLSDRAC